MSIYYSNTFSTGNITKYLKSEYRSVSSETLYNYIDYCQTACLLHLVPREDVIGKSDVSEVDFIAKKGNDKIYVQVTYLLSGKETVAREFESLEKIPDNYPKFVVSMDEINRGRNGIKHMNIRDFLLCKEFT